MSTCKAFTTSIIGLISILNSCSFVPLTKNAFHTPSSIYSKNDDIPQQQAFADGTILEFSEKSRVHVGRIISTEHKSNGGARYEIMDHDGKKFSIADKAVSYAVSAPNNEPAAVRLFDAFYSAHEESESELRTDLDISPEMLELAWEEAASDDTFEDHVLTPKALIDLVHSKAASAVDAYKAWRLLKTDIAHVFFKEMKEKGRVVGFKAKPLKAVEAAKTTFCRSEHAADDLDFCLV